MQANIRKMRAWSHFFLSVQTLAEPCHWGKNQSQLKEVRQGVNPKFLKMSRGLLCVELCPSKIIHWGRNPGTSDCDHIWRQGHFRGDWVKMRSSGWSLNKRPMSLQKGELWTQKHMLWEDHVCPPHQYLHLGFKPPQLWENKFLLFKTPSLQYLF